MYPERMGLLYDRYGKYIPAEEIAKVQREADRKNKKTNGKG